MWYKSSVPGSDSISLTIKSLLLAIVPVAVMITKSYGLDLAETDLVEIVEKGFAALAAVGIVYGLFRKLYYRLGLGA